MKSYADYIAKVQKLLLDKSFQTQQDDAQSALDTAMDTLAQYRLAIKVQEYPSTGVRFYSLPINWDLDRSKYDVEYPVDDTVDEVQLLDPDMTELYRVPVTVDPQGMVLRFRNKEQSSDYLPPSGSKFRLHYGVPYILQSAASTTIVAPPDSLFEAICKLGARELCLIMSSRLAQNASGITTGQPIDFRQGYDPFLKLADTFWKDFLNKISPSQKPGKVVFGSFVETPLHRYARTLYPRDTSLRAYTDR